MRKLYTAKQDGKPPRKILKFEDLQDGDLIEIVEFPSYNEVPQDLEDKMEWIKDTVSMSSALYLFISHYDLPDNTLVREQIKIIMRWED